MAGYSRTADYTRKTQALAEAAKANQYALAVQRALQAQPAETIRLLANQYNVNFDTPQSPPSTQQPWEQPSYDEGSTSTNLYSDPEADRLAAIQKRLDDMDYTLQRRSADEAVRAEVGALRQKYQLDDATVQETIGIALQAGLGPGQLEMVYKNLAFDRAQQARALAQQQHGEQQAQRRAASANAQQLISSGSSANSAGAPMNNGASDGHMSIREAFDAAIDEHGGLPSF